MRYASMLVLAVAFAGQLAAEPDWSRYVADAEGAPASTFPRALRLAEAWRGDAVPAHVVGDATFEPPPPGLAHVEVPPEALGGGGGSGGVSGDAVADAHAFVDPPTGDALVVLVPHDEDAPAALVEHPGALPPTRPPTPSPLADVQGPVEGALDLVDGALAPPARPLPASTSASTPEAPLTSDPATGAPAWLGWWLRVVWFRFA